MKIKVKQATPIKMGSHAFVVAINDRRRCVVYTREEGQRDQHEVERMFDDIDMNNIDPEKHKVCSVSLKQG